ncbi:MFS transporter [Novosphingobium aquae]|uniref:MFS transporter n=1 Tax=Novosphingobium aquae TaxID=3133435 RepID=A0ABU8S8H4_9SPHN
MAKLATATKAGFGVGQIAGQLFRDVPSLLLLFYLTTVMGIAPAVAGSAIFLPKVIFGAGFDLAVGIGSDRMAARFPRRGWLIAGGAIAPVAMLAVFAVPDGSPTLQVIWVFVTFSLYMATFSTFSVPYLAQFAEMSPDPAERTELMAWKHGFTGVGVLLSSAAAPALVGYLGGDRGAYLVTSGLVGLVCLACLVTAWRYAARIPDRVSTGTPLALRDLPKAFGDRNFMVLCLSAVIMTVASGISYASFAFFIKFVMNRSDAFVQVGILSAIMAFAVMAGSPIWVKVAARIGKKNTYVLAACGHGFATLAWALLGQAPIWVSYGLAAVMAMFNAGWGLIVLSLLADAISDARERWGENRAGVYSAIWSMIEKAGIALGGTLIVGGLLSASGFDAGAAQQGLAQSASATAGIILSYAVLPGLAKLVAAALIWRCVGNQRQGMPSAA